MCEVRDLKPNGANILVTEENKKEYVHLVCQMKMTGEFIFPKGSLLTFSSGTRTWCDGRLFVFLFDFRCNPQAACGLLGRILRDHPQETDLHLH